MLSAGMDGFGGDLDVPENGDVLQGGVDGLSERSFGEFDFYGIAAEFAFEGFSRALGDDATAIDDGNILREAIGFFEIVGGEKNRETFRGEMADFLPQFGASLGVEAGGGLVEEQNARTMDESHSDIELAFHAAGVSTGDARGGAAEGEAVQ